MKPRVLMVGRTRYRLPLNGSLERKFAALEDRLALRVLASAPRDASAGDGTFALQRATPVPALDGPLFYGALPVRIARELRHRPADAILAQSPYEALAAFAGRTLARSDAAVVVEIHGDWRTWSRLYGSPARAVVAPLADRAALVAIRGADAVRTLSPFTSGIVRDAGVEPAGVFTTYTELSAFSDPPVAPLPERPVALFVGVLERYKNVHAIADAWRLAAPRAPEALLRMVGDGRHRDVAEGLVRDLPGQVSWERRLETPDVVTAFDDAWLLLLASRSEGTPQGRAGGAVSRPRRGRRARGRDPGRRLGRRDGPPRRPRQPHRDRGRARADPLRPRPGRAPRCGGARARGRVDVHGRGVRGQRRRARRTSGGGPGGMRLVVVTQQVDPASPVLGATVDKLRALALRVDELVVLADSAVEGALPANCRVRPFRAAHRAGRGVRFETALARELARRPRPAAVLAHMCPIYAVLAAPLARPVGVDVFLWFTHWRKSRMLRAAERLSTKVLSVDARTFPLRSRKLVAIGHGIDVTGLQCVDAAATRAR